MTKKYESYEGYTDLPRKLPKRFKELWLGYIDTGVILPSIGRTEYLIMAEKSPCKKYVAVIISVNDTEKEENGFEVMFSAYKEDGHEKK